MREKRNIQYLSHIQVCNFSGCLVPRIRILWTVRVIDMEL